MAEEGDSEPIAVRFEKALEKKHPYFLPVMLMIPGLVLFFLLYYLSLNDILANHPSFDPFVIFGYDLEIGKEIISAIFIGAMPVAMLVAFLVFLVPLTVLILIAGKGMVALGLSQDIIQPRKKFGGIQLVFRSLLPALFGVGIGQAALNLLTLDPSIPGQPWPPSFTVILTLYYGIVGMATAMALFPTTWFLDDAGLVIHGWLKTPYRVPPKVDGVGNWIRVFFAGLTIFLYPITMIWTFIIQPGALPLFDLVLVSLIIIIGIPLSMMAINIPFVLLAEHLQPRVLPRIQAMARRMGAKNIALQDVKYEETKSEEDE